MRAAFREVAARLLPQPAGYVDYFDADRVAGWAVDSRGSGRPATLSLSVDGQPVMKVSAHLPRDDVARSGRAPLRCGFDIALPARVRDGEAHVIELRIDPDGPRLRGGRLRIAEGEVGRGAAGATHPEAAEGVAWFDRSRTSISGWATGCSNVSISVDDGAVQDVDLTREVAGFGAGNRQGFFFALPDALADGAVHKIEVRAGHWGDAVALDGSPLEVRFGSTRPRLSVQPDGTRRLRIMVRDRDGSPHVGPVMIALNGNVLADECGMPDRSGEIILDLPEEARHLTITTVPVTETGETVAYVLGRFVISGDGAVQEWSADIPDIALDRVPLAPDLLAQARMAFDAFVTAPDSRFDEEWVAAAAGLSAPEAALEYWSETGACAGMSPGPSFDEATARVLHPGVAQAVADGALPCAFALELVLGAGALGTMTGIAQSRAAKDIAPKTAPEEAQVLPPITTWCPPNESIYAAWLARLQLSNRQRATIDADERIARREVASTQLQRQPLVSIIMPSWNRAFTIGEAIQSVLEQSYPNWELLICDDASEDRTADVVRDFEDRRIRYMRFQKSNGAGARNHGLRRARGDYIAYLDSDNIWHPLFLDVMLRALMATPGQSIAYSAYLDTETRGAAVVLHEIARPHFRPVQLSSKNFMDLNAIMHHRRVLDWMGGFDGELPRLQDWDLVLRYTSVFGARFVPRIGVFYRRNLAWGQVTHTQMGSGAQDTVNNKTQARLAGAHERLDLEWPGPSDVTVLCGPGASHTLSGEAAATAATLTRMASRLGAVETISIGQGPVLADTGSGQTRTLENGLLADPRRLGAVLADLRAGPVLATGFEDDHLRQVPGLDPARVYRPVSRADGTWLEPLTGPAGAFLLGAMPLDMPPRRSKGTDLRANARGPILVLGSDAALSDPAWVAALQQTGLDALVPPMIVRPVWTLIGASGVTEITVLEQGLPPEIGTCVASVVLGSSLADLSPWQMAVLNGVMAYGTPAAVPSERAPDSLAAQWIEARAAYALTSDKPSWIFDKIPKLLADSGSMARLSERAHMVHRIALAPELAHQRLVHLLWRLQFDPPRIEVAESV